MLPTIIGSGIVAGIVVAIVYFKVRAHRMGKSSCGCGCSDCPSSGACHPK